MLRGPTIGSSAAHRHTPAVGLTAFCTAATMVASGKTFAKGTNMTSPPEIAGMELVAESNDMRFTKWRLGPGESIPAGAANF